MTKQLLLLDPLYPPCGSRLGAGCISFENWAHAQAFRGSAQTGPPTTTTLRLDTSSLLTRGRGSCSPPKAAFPAKPALPPDTSPLFTPGPPLPPQAPLQAAALPLGTSSSFYIPCKSEVWQAYKFLVPSRVRVSLSLFHSIALSLPRALRSRVPCRCSSGLSCCCLVCRFRVSGGPPCLSVAARAHRPPGSVAG